MRSRPRSPGCAPIEHDTGPTCAGADPPGPAAAAAHAPRSWRPSRRGGYVLLDCEGTPECLVIATGSEVAHRARGGQARATAPGRRVRLVSMPSPSASTPRMRPTASRCCRRAVTRARGGGGGRDAAVVALCRQRAAACSASITYGASGKAPEVFEHFGFTADHVATGNSRIR